MLICSKIKVSFPDSHAHESIASEKVCPNKPVLYCRSCRYYSRAEIPARCLQTCCSGQDMEEFATLDRGLISSFRAMFGDWEPRRLALSFRCLFYLIDFLILLLQMGCVCFNVVSCPLFHGIDSSLPCTSFRYLSLHCLLCLYWLFMLFDVSLLCYCVDSSLHKHLH